MSYRYEKIDNNTFVKVLIDDDPDVVKLSDIQHQINELKELQKATEPTKKELEDFARQMHPYYQDMIGIQQKIDELEQLKNELQNLK